VFSGRLDDCAALQLGNTFMMCRETGGKKLVIQVDSEYS
jgi:hypothetical protein